jgi:transcriptional regulator GlxA family with amidase domain
MRTSIMDRHCSTGGAQWVDMARQKHHPTRHEATPPAPRPLVAIPLLDRHWAGSVMLARELLQIAGTLRTRSSDVAAGALFDIVLVGLDRRAVASFGGPRLKPETTIGELAHADVVIVPAQFAPSPETSRADERFGAWLRALHAQGAVLVSLADPLLLAKAGLLDRREATGLVSEREIFRTRFPQVRYLPSRRVVASGDIVTVCGIGPTPDACAHLVERFHGAALARRFLRHTSAEVLPADEQTALWSARFKHHPDAQVLAVQEIVERELHAVPTLAHLAARVGLSERTLSRRLRAATGLALRHYVAELRLERSEFLLRTGDMALVHIAQDCGYGSASAFSRAFAARHGEGPAGYRRTAQRRTAQEGDAPQARALPPRAP